VYRLIKKYWFLIGLFLVFVITVADVSETVSSVGGWLKMHRGPDAVIVLVFFFSGLILDARQIRSDVMDIKGIIAALIIYFFGCTGHRCTIWRYSTGYKCCHRCFSRCRYAYDIE